MNSPNNTTRITRRRMLATSLAAGCLGVTVDARAAKPAAETWRQFAARAGDRTPGQREVDASLAKAAAWLVAQQADDGSWRSEEYGALRDGVSLTPTICTTLYYLPQGGAAARGAFVAGRGYLDQQVDDEGRLGNEFHPYPIYSAAAASWVAVLGRHDETARRTQQAWIKFLRARQFSKQLGWTKDDAQFGGWGYTVRPPQKLAADALAPQPDANISATLFALGALSNAQVPLNDPAVLAARAFVKRCQNFSRKEGDRNDPGSDGGFFFSPTDAARNKAGAIGSGEAEGYRSYGSATADGLRALLRTGFAPNHPRVVAAADWLRAHFTTDTIPGDFTPESARLAQSYYFYYCWSAAHAFLHLGQAPFKQQRGDERILIDWRRELAEALLARQQEDGSWRNRFRDAKEDDPLVATPLAAAALAVCRMAEETDRMPNR